MKYEKREQERYEEMQVGDFQYAAVQNNAALPAVPAKKKKNPLVLAGLLTVAGAAIMAIGIVGMESGSYGEVTYTVTTYNAAEADEITEVVYEGSANAEIVDMTGITAVNITCNAGSIEIVSGDTFSIENMSNVLSYSKNVADGVMTIEYGVSSDRKLLDSDSGSLFVTVPQMLVDDFDVTVNLGRASISDLSCGNVDLQLNAGELVVQNLTSDNASINVKAGDAYISGCTSAESFFAEIAAGDMEISDLLSADMSVSSGGGNCNIVDVSGGNVNISCKAGNVLYSGDIETGANIDVSMGDVELDLSRNAGEYLIKESNSQMSDVTVNGMTLSDYIRENPDGTIPINITANMSDVEING